MTRRCGLAAVMAAAMFLCSVKAVAAFQRSQLDALSEAFWSWRATEQPFTNDDIPRIERAGNFTVDWSPAAVKGYRSRIAGFESQWRALDLTGASVADQVDYRLLGSAIARVYWELDVMPMWRENPDFYVQQSLGSVYAIILPPGPFAEGRQEQLLARLERIPATLDAARQNLTDMRGPYVRVALSELDRIESRLTQFATAMAPELSESKRARFQTEVERARTSLISYREWLKTKTAGLPEKTAVGREGYLYFL